MVSGSGFSKLGVPFGIPILAITEFRVLYWGRDIVGN